MISQAQARRCRAARFPRIDAGTLAPADASARLCPPYGTGLSSRPLREEKHMKMPMIALALSMMSAPALAATFVYVSNAEDGTIGMYTLQADGSLQPGARVEAAKVVMPMAVSPDKRFLIAAVRSKPYEAYTYSIDKTSGALKLVGKGPLAESYPYITIDNTGRYLLGASYGANQVGVNPIGEDGKVGEPQQVIPTARNAHSIRTDNTNRYVFVPHLGTDQIFQFVFDAKTGKLSANTPPIVQMKQG